MSNNRRRRPPMSVAEAEAALSRARRREAAQAANPAGHGHYSITRGHVDLDTLDTPDVSHADQWAEFLNRPGRFYVATIDVAVDDDAMGEKLSTRTTLKADDDQLPYLVEVLRQVRGAFGAHTRISLTPAEPNVEERRVAGPVRRAEPTVRVSPDVKARQVAAGRAAELAARNRIAQRTGIYPEPARASAATQIERCLEDGGHDWVPVPFGESHRCSRCPVVGALNVPPVNECNDPFPTPDDGPPQIYGRDWVADGQDFEPNLGPHGVDEPIRRDDYLPPDREFTRDELAAILPGQSRTEIAGEIGQAPEDLGGTIHAADVMPEDLAAELGVPVESLTRIPMVGGGHAWTITPTRREPAGRHAAPDEEN